MMVVCALELVLLRHVHSNERLAASTSEVMPIIQEVVHRPIQRPLPPPTPQATSKHIKKPDPPTYNDSDFQNCTILRPSDSIYQFGPWDAAPIVLERYQLLLFTIPKVGCTLLKQFCRRAMGYQDWLDDVHPLPHAPRRNGLEYLYDYPPSVADHMLTSPDWTRAIFVREPLERLLSAYLDKGLQNQYMQYHCCRGLDGEEGDDDDAEDDVSQEEAITFNATINKRLHDMLQCSQRQKHQGPMASELDRKHGEQTPLLSFANFIFLTQHHPSPECRHDPHWSPQARRLDLKYWSKINFVGHMETMAVDTQRLLEHVGAWEEHGRTGWPPNGGAMFAGPVTVHHATDSNRKLAEYYQQSYDATRSTLAVVKELTRKDFELIPGLVMPQLSAFDLAAAAT